MNKEEYKKAVAETLSTIAKLEERLNFKGINIDSTMWIDDGDDDGLGCDIDMTSYFRYITKLLCLLYNKTGYITTRDFDEIVTDLINRYGLSIEKAREVKRYFYDLCTNGTMELYDLPGSSYVLAVKLKYQDSIAKIHTM